MGAKLFDTERVRAQMMRVTQAPVIEEIAGRLRERLGEMKGQFPRVLEVGWEGLADDYMPPEGPFDAVISNLVLTAVNDVPALLYKCLQVLRPDGVLLMSVLGSESFRELRVAWGEGGHVVDMADLRGIGGLLQRLKVALPVVDRDVMTVTFGGFAQFYASLRAHGTKNWNPGRPRGLTVPARLKAMEKTYPARGDGRIGVTVEVLYLQGFKAAEHGQPHAARRGSGKVSLVRILS